MAKMPFLGRHRMLAIPLVPMALPGNALHERLPPRLPSLAFNPTRDFRLCVFGSPLHSSFAGAEIMYADNKAKSKLRMFRVA